jgi:hypothetical protein
MSGRVLVTVTGSSLMVGAAVVAASLIWVIATDPLGVATLAATEGVGTLVAALVWQMLTLIW